MEEVDNIQFNDLECISGSGNTTLRFYLMSEKDMEKVECTLGRMKRLEIEFIVENENSSYVVKFPKLYYYPEEMVFAVKKSL